GVPRPYSRYGIFRDLFIKELERVRQPEAILVTSLMTYWYPGVCEAINLAKERHPGVPVILGGIYARLCRDHALRFSGADVVASDVGLHMMDHVQHLLGRYGISLPQDPPTSSKSHYPAFDMLRKIDYVCLLTSTGCPYQCSYCASPFLNPMRSRRDPGEVLEEILYWHRDFGVNDFAFYDDALLVGSDVHMAPLLEDLIRRNLDLRFHTPNGLHLREITPDLARLLFLSGFRTIRLGLETSDLQLHRDLGNKVGKGEFERAVQCLEKAGFSKKDVGAYILIGLPGQTVDSV
ncbi:MAG: radical SAM protein, partial [Deltaproteobacteria bacterium]|nr:radical SAM protein [Deltaproteobacteria bacterium]